MERRTLLAGFLLSALLVGGTPARSQKKADAQEIPIERCDTLPVVPVAVDGMDMRFLVDTAATSMLNLKSFSGGSSKDIRVTSWTGTAATSAREVTLPALALGNYRLTNLKLPAIDLSPIGKACGGRIDGILGIDLLERMGATIDLQRRIALVPNPSPTTAAPTDEEEFHAFMSACIEALNRADVRSLEECLDAELVLFTPWGEMNGRQAVVEYLGRRFFSLDPPPRFDFRGRSLRLLADVAWYTYDYTIQQPDSQIEARGVAFCQKTGGRWRLLNMHNSFVESANRTAP
jgi:hypothetical protein